MSKTVVAFDLYGTLLSTASISKVLEQLYGNDKAHVIATQARMYQLEYTWRVNSMLGPSQHKEVYHSFSDLTRWSFRHAAAEAGVKMTATEEERIMNAYNGLQTYPDADAGLKLLAQTPAVDPYIFSNGTSSMLNSSMASAPGLNGVNELFPKSKIISVEGIRVFKPDPRVYDYLVQIAGKVEDPQSVWLVSSNPFDAVGAVAAGLKSVWVGRGAEWVDGLGMGSGNNPTLVANGVDEAIQAIVKHDGATQ